MSPRAAGIFIIVSLLIGLMVGMRVPREEGLAQDWGLFVVKPSITGLEGNEFPRMDGSASLRPLGQLLLAQALGLNGALRRLPLESSAQDNAGITFPVDTDQAEVDSYRNKLDRINFTDTRVAYRRLITRDQPSSPDVILVARKPSPEEQALAKSRGVKLDIRAIALDALVFVNNVANTATGLTMDEVRAIYSGKITRWKAIENGQPWRIMPFVREEKSNCQELMMNMVMKGRPFREKLPVESSMIGLLDRVSDNPNGLGYSLYYYTSFMSPNKKNRVLTVDGVAPSRYAIEKRRYPLVTEIYAVIREDTTPNSPAAKVRDWLLHNDGKKLIVAGGYVPAK